MIFGTMRGAALALTLAISTICAAPAVAGSIEEKDLLKGKETIEPDQAYIFLHAPQRMVGWLLREPTQEDLDRYQADREKAYTDALKAYERAASHYDDEVKFARNNGFRISPRPVKPERDSFSIGPIEARMGETFGPQFVYSKGEGYFSYLMSVPPGTYTYYGSIFFNSDSGFIGVCECMGSIRFEAKAGKITNLGDFLSMGWATPEQLKLSSVFNYQVNGIGMDVGPWFTEEKKVNQADAAQIGGRVPVPTNYDLPPSLASYPNERADFRATGKIDNFMGVRVARFPPVPGVLDYDRDKVIDLVAKAHINAAAAAAEEPAGAERERLATEPAPSEAAKTAEPAPGAEGSAVE